VASPSSAIAETRSRSPFAQAPPSRRAASNSPVTGLWMTPTVTSPCSSRPISVAHTGRRRMKLLVPSIGSMIHRRC
jgi:hypothetical protein